MKTLQKHRRLKRRSYLNSALATSPTSAKISHDADLNRFIVKIMDDLSGEIVREIPSEALLKFARNLRSLRAYYLTKHSESS